MKRNSNGRKHVQPSKDGKSGGVSVENDSQDLDTGKTELEARLQRLENAHSNVSTDVYKFVFFFFMGVVLTALIYPRISSTIDTTHSVSPNSAPANPVDTGYSIEQIDDLDIEENSKSGQPNRGNLHSERRGYTRTNESKTETDSLQGRTNNNEAQPESENDKVLEENIKSADTEQNVVREMGNQVKESVSLKSEGFDLKPERVEDLMIEEYEDSNSQSIPITFSVDEQIEDVNTNTENDEPKRVELFSANIADIQKDSPAVVDKATTNEPNLSSKKKPKRSEKNKGATGSTKVSTNKNEKKDSGTKEDEKIPKEIRDFKATYQRDLKPKKVFIDGRRIPPMELLPQKPNNSSVKVWLFEDFLSEEECDGLMRVHNKHIQEQSKDDPILCFDSITTLRKHLKSAKKRVNVTPMDFTAGTTCVNESFSLQLKQWLQSNWSYSTAFYPGESRFAAVYEQRVKQAMGLNPENGGKFQITSYPLDIGYKAHTDCTENSDDKRDRMATVLVYLDTVGEGGGGETEFTELGIWARPRKGRALLWNSMNTEGDCEAMSIHKANKVVDGHKYILQRWYYYKSFYSLGKRPPDPPLPERKPGQPRVSCDEYEHGSCRWYDEWNFEHMIEYERQKYTLV